MNDFYTEYYNMRDNERAADLSTRYVDRLAENAYERDFVLEAIERSKDSKEWLPTPRPDDWEDGIC